MLNSKFLEDIYWVIPFKQVNKNKDYLVYFLLLFAKISIQNLFSKFSMQEILLIETDFLHLK